MWYMLAELYVSGPSLLPRYKLHVLSVFAKVAEGALPFWHRSFMIKKIIVISRCQQKNDELLQGKCEFAEKKVVDRFTVMFQLSKYKAPTDKGPVGDWWGWSFSNDSPLAKHSRLGCGREHGTVNPIGILFSFLVWFQYKSTLHKSQKRRAENDVLRLNWRESGREEAKGVREAGQPK